MSRLLKSPNPRRLLIAAAPAGRTTLNLFFFFYKFPVLPSGLLQSPGVGPTGPFQYLERLHLKAQSTTIRGHEEDIGNFDFCQISGCLQSNS